MRCDSNLNSSKSDEDFPGLKKFYVNNTKNLKIGLLNINSFRNKSDPLIECLGEGYLDMLFIQETKLDDTFPAGQFNIPDFKLYRRDYKSNEGGLLVYIRSDIPHAICTDYDRCIVDDQRGRIEILTLEVTLKNEKWHIISIYKQPKVSISDFIASFEEIMDICNSKCSNCIVCGDLNIDLSKRNASFNDALDVYGLKNLVDSPTCFKGKTPTTLDLYLTNKPRRFLDKLVLDTGLSDFHHMVCIATRLHVPSRKNKSITYRSYKHFNEGKFNEDISNVPFHVSEIFDDVNDSYWFCDKLLGTIIDVHAPTKKRKIKHNYVPYMNGNLRKAMNVKNMLRRKYYQSKTPTAWNTYRNQRNLVTKLRRQSIRLYVSEKCNGENINGKEFWRTVKPLISNKAGGSIDSIILREHDNIITNTDTVCDVLNEFYVNVTKDIGPDDSIQYEDSIENIIEQYKDHDSIRRINENVDQSRSFSFQRVTSEDVFKILNKLNPRKATGYDNIPPKLLRICARSICAPLAELVNMSLTQCVFPDALKYANVSPIYKKEDNMNKKNYRPVSVLPCISKLFEQVMVTQLTTYFDGIFSPHVSGFRAGHSCETVLLRFINNIKSSQDNGNMTGALLMDLSKAFDCLPHKLLIAKFDAYGLDNKSCQLLSSYFSDRYQRVKIGNNTSNWSYVDKGAPQGSKMGPFSFNLHSNDFMYIMNNECDIYNYADDNTICSESKHLEDIKRNIESQAELFIKWFESNYMKVNPDKFQAIVFGTNDEIVFTVGDQQVKSQNEVKLLGVTFDVKLKFETHASDMCKKAGKQLSVMKRLSNTLTEDGKLLLYNTFIFSNFNYCSLIWHFCPMNCTIKMEKIQKRSLRFVYNDFNSSYKCLMDRCNKSTLFVNRQRMMLLYVYKMLNNAVPLYLCNSFQLDNNMYNTRCFRKVKQPCFKTITHGRNAMLYQGAQMWNVLPNDFKMKDSYGSFKAALSKWKGNVCVCNVCPQCRLMNV